MGKFYKMVDLSTDELKKSFYDLLDSKISMESVYNEYGLTYSNTNSSDLKKLAKEVGFDLSIYKERQSKSKKYCLQCGKELIGWQTKFCSNSCAATYNNIKRGSRSDESRKKISERLKAYYSYYSYYSLNKKQPPIRLCKYCGNEFIPTILKNNRYSSSKFCSSNCRNNFLSENSKNKNCGGYRENSAKNYKYGTYKNIYCDSSWELAFVVWHLDHNINIERCKEIRKYELNGNTFNFHPDFVVNNKIYEIKGINDEISKAKSLYNPDVIFLYRKDMNMYLNYMYKKYGKDFIYLYE